MVTEVTMPLGPCTSGPRARDRIVTSVNREFKFVKHPRPQPQGSGINCPSLPTTGDDYAVYAVISPLGDKAQVVAAIAWLAQKEYSKRSDDGKLLATWEDNLGRPWFEAENTRFHVRGYIVSRGFEAWIIYCGYRLEQPGE